jgi:xanthine dehydrogenase accessory factor
VRLLDSALDTVVVRGAGDIATGVMQKFWRAGFYALALETASPLTIRRAAALSSAVREGRWTVEDMTAERAADMRACRAIWRRGHIPVLVDPAMTCLAHIRPAVLVDAIIAKRNLGMRPGLAPVTIGLGPGFSAPDDVDCVIETMRGQSLGRLITRGKALPNTGIPGMLGGKGADRVVHAPCTGKVAHVRCLGDQVTEGETLFTLSGSPVVSPLSGILRGLIAEGLEVPKGTKCADIDPRPRGDVEFCTISDKSRALGGAALEACFMLAGEKGILLRPIRHLRERQVECSAQV